MDSMGMAICLGRPKAWECLFACLFVLKHFLWKQSYEGILLATSFLLPVPAQLCEKAALP